MEYRRRFVFRGNAAAIGGRIVRPDADKLVLESDTASSLTAVGGLSRARAGAKRFGRWIGFDSAETLAEGLYDDVQQHIELTRHLVPKAAVTTSTRVFADVAGLSVGDRPKLTGRRLHAELHAHSPNASGEPPIAVASETKIEGLAIDGHELVVELAVPLFQQCNTRSKLLTAADNPDFVRDSGDCLFMTSAIPGAPPPPTGEPPTGRLLHCLGTIYATIVKSIKWADSANPHPNARIDHHAVIVKDFGTIFVGELLITDVSRRLTLLRLQLGSDLGGDVACAEVESNGIWS